MIRFFLSMICFFFGLRLLFASEEVLNTYLSWGFTASAMKGAGLLQVVAGILIWRKSLELLALFALWTIVAAAGATHFRLQHEWHLFLPAVMVGGLVLLRSHQILRDARSPKTATTPPTSSFTKVENQGLNSADQTNPLPCPEGYSDLPFEISYRIPASRNRVAAYLNATRTFTKGQLFPYRVEFLDPRSGAMTDQFLEGVLTNHHGPFLSAAGVLSRIEGAQYRRLDYFYGSYAISFRLFRPHRLEIWFQSESLEKTKVIVKLSTFCRKGWGWLWKLGQYLFWPQFGLGIRLALLFSRAK